MSSETFVQRWQNINEQAILGGGQARIDKQHANNKLTARERLQLLFDEGTFQEYDKYVTHRCHDFGMEK
jgi:propionyl-CoA carboxylase beta chain